MTKQISQIKKIAFLYIDKPYSTYHSITIAVELAKSPSFDIHILCTERNYKLVLEILSQFNCKNITVHLLRPYWYFTMPFFFEAKAQLKKTIFYKYKNLLQSYDSFVCTIYTDLFLKKILKKQKHTKYIFTNHGISNRAYSFDERVREFDLFFILGKQEQKMRKKMNHLTPFNHVTIGFLKYDAIVNIPNTNFFDNSKPTILYNPHWVKEFTSFHKFIDNILDFFVKNKSYNLILAPHARLIEKNPLYRFKLKRYKKHENILIDWESEASNNMSYTNYADIYMGDISSQAIEFVFVKERPCLFLDAHNLTNNRANRPLSWDLGTVVSEIISLEDTIKLAIENHKNKYQQEQIDKKKEMFYSSSQSPSFLATQAIRKLLDES